ncbi:MAG: hypothetical protein IPL19_09035 [Sandaracinaceae bacterium]|nr:hypothetical protein [Sandaracinaceae bacterium]
MDGGGPVNYAINSRNLNSRLRYDIFLTENDALPSPGASLGASPGLQTRASFRLAYLRNLIKNESTRVWPEAGYDFTFDNRQNSANQRVICSEADVANRCSPSARAWSATSRTSTPAPLLRGHPCVQRERDRRHGVRFLVNLNQEVEAGGEADRFDDIHLNLGSQPERAPGGKSGHRGEVPPAVRPRAGCLRGTSTPTRSSA